jgi:hypothetical protein
MFYKCYRDIYQRHSEKWCMDAPFNEPKDEKMRSINLDSRKYFKE